MIVLTLYVGAKQFITIFIPRGKLGGTDNDEITRTNK
jgi:hypothetical protein